MCGICGVIARDSREIEPAVRRMMRFMVHRGPDDGGYAEVPLGGADHPAVAGLGFRRLAILDLSPAGHQPMVNPATGDWIVFNGEIYNFRDLRAELESEGVAFRGTSDTEVLLHALSRWGDAALGKVQGMFALAFHDARTRRLLLARDPLGIKPLYVAALPDRFLFASEVRGLVASGMVSLEPDVGGVAGMLAYGAVQSPRTVYRDIRSFPAGHSQWIDARVATGGRAEPSRPFWQFPEPQPAGSVDAATAAAEVGRLLHQSVQRHLVADVPVGVLLSAGLDSTAIAVQAREHAAGLTAFTVGFPGAEVADETAIAARTAASIGIRHVAIEVAPDELPAMWEDWLARMDSPSIDGFNTRIVSKRIRDEGVVVGLSGLGADELFGGYPTFKRAPVWARRMRWCRFLPPDLRSMAVQAVGLFDKRSSSVEKLADIAACDGSAASITRGLRRALSDRRLRALGLRARDLGLGGDYIEPGRAVAPGSHIDPINAVSRAELSHYMRDTLLRDSDINSMAWSLEMRVPFLDQPLVDYALSLPGDVKWPLNQPWKKVLRDACGRLVPAEVMDRRKTGFFLPINAWMRRDLRDVSEAAIRHVAQLPFLEGREVQRVWDDFLAEKPSMHWSRPLALVVLGTFLLRVKADAATAA
jgi:asparagine synthase (glutamine-hydrolysing)